MIPPACGRLTAKSPLRYMIADLPTVQPRPESIYKGSDEVNAASDDGWVGGRRDDWNERTEGEVQQTSPLTLQLDNTQGILSSSSWGVRPTNWKAEP